MHCHPCDVHLASWRLQEAVLPGQSSFQRKWSSHNHWRHSAEVAEAAANFPADFCASIVNCHRGRGNCVRTRRPQCDQQPRPRSVRASFPFVSSAVLPMRIHNTIRHERSACEWPHRRLTLKRRRWREASTETGVLDVAHPTQSDSNDNKAKR